MVAHQQYKKEFMAQTVCQQPNCKVFGDNN